MMKRCILIFFFCFNWVVTAQESYTLSSESTLTISGTSTVHEWEVTANAILGSMTATDEVINDLKIEVPVSEIKSERGVTMDTKMHEALKAENHPTVLFELKEQGQNGVLIGTLMVAGVEKEIEVAVKRVQDTEKVRISGTQEILLADYGMEPPTAMFGQIVVGDTVTVVFNVVFQKE